MRETTARAIASVAVCAASGFIVTYTAVGGILTMIVCMFFVWGSA